MSTKKKAKTVSLNKIFELKTDLKNQGIKHYELLFT